MKRNSIKTFYFFIFCLFFPLTISAQAPQMINYQAMLADPATGKSIPDSIYPVVFSIYDAPTGGTALWTETQNIQTQNGLFNVMLGSITPITPSILSGAEKYLGVKVGADLEMTPRRRIVSSAYSILSEDADKLDGLHASDFSTSDGDPPNQGTNLVNWDNLVDVPAGFADGIDNAGPAGAGNTLDQAYDQSGPGAGRTIIADAGAVNIDGTDGLTVNGNVGIGTTSPSGKLDVIGNINIGSATADGEFKTYRNGSSNEVIRGFTSGGGGRVHLNDELGNATIFLEDDVNNEGGWVQILRSTASPGFTIDGNFQGSKEPRVTISGSARSVAFNLDQTGDASVALPQNAINTSEILNEAGVASNIGSGVILTGGVEVLLSRSIVCPANGYVFVIGTCESSFSHTTGINSNARFGVSDVSNSFPSNQDVELRFSSIAPTASYNLPITVHGLFQVNSGTNTFYFLAHELSGDFNVFDSQLSLIFFPTAYGTVTPTLASQPGASDEEIAKSSAMSSNEINAERIESESFNTLRIEKEMAKMKTEIEALKKELNKKENQGNQ